MLGEEPIELGLKGREQEFLSGCCARDPVYQRSVSERVSRRSRISFTLANVTKAIAAFERTIVSMRSPYDRYRWGGDVIGDFGFRQARRISVLHSSEHGGCFQCHGGWNFSGGPIRRKRDASEARSHARRSSTPAYRPTRLRIAASTNTREIPKTSGKFRVPTLRNIALTAPYMHDGSLADA